jgi:hypothetical protein
LPPIGPHAASPVAQMLFTHPAWPSQAQLGAGWSVPPIESPREIEITADQEQALEALGITLRKPPGAGNWLLLDAATPKQNIRLDLSRAQDCKIILPRDGVIRGDILMLGKGHVFASAGADGPTGTTIHSTLRGRDSLVLVGRGTTSNEARLLVDGVGCAIVIGDDAMFSSGIAIRTHDAHAIIDIADKRHINPPASVLVGPHVWIGEDVMVTKGLTIGTGSILGGRAIITSDIPARVLAAGVPARVIRTGVTWSRKLLPSDEDIEETLGRWVS